MKLQKQYRLWKNLIEKKELESRNIDKNMKFKKLKPTEIVDGKNEYFIKKGRKFIPFDGETGFYSRWYLIKLWKKTGKIKTK